MEATYEAIVNVSYQVYFFSLSQNDVVSVESNTLFTT